MTSFEDCVVFASKSLGLDFSLKDKQLETLRALYDGHDCVSVMPTGYGKSVIFQCLPWLFQCKRGLQYPLITLVVSPLTSLMQDQVMTLCEKGIKACFLNCEGTHGSTYKLRGEEENDSDDDQDKTDVHASCSTSLIDLQRGAYNIIYAHPETLLNNRNISSMLRSKLYKQRVCAVVIDEVHMVSEWCAFTHIKI